jgi:hypothetical protein
MPPEEDIEAEPNPIDGAPLVTRKISDIEVSRRGLRIFLANRAIALGWALKGSCKACAHRLFTTARWLVPEAQRFLVHRTGSHNRNRRIFEFAVDLRTLLSRIQPLGVAAGFLIVLVLLGSLDLATRGESQIASENKVLSVSKFSEPTQGFNSEPAPVSGTQSEPVPLPTRKPEGVYELPNGEGAKANAATQKTVAQQKSARPKRRR